MSETEEWEPDFEALARDRLSDDIADLFVLIEPAIYDTSSAVRTGDREEIIDAATVLKTRLQEANEHVDHYLAELAIDPEEAQPLHVSEEWREVCEDVE